MYVLQQQESVLEVMIQPESDKVMDDNVGHPEKLIEEILANPPTLDDQNFAFKQKKNKVIGNRWENHMEN